MDFGLSVCLITKNEEIMLPDCLDLVRSIADEIVLVDTGSNDKTIDIARNYGCRIFNQAWQKDFSLARNYALSQARFSHILSIDADERLINPEILKPTIQSSPNNIGGWLIEVVSKAKRKDGSFDTYISNLLRLFVNHPNIRFIGAIHEQIVESVLAQGLKLENSNLKIIHHGYSHENQQMQAKQLRNLELLNNTLSINPDDATNTYQRAKTYLALGDLVNAEKDVSLALSIVNPDSAIKPQALNFGAVIAYQNKDFSLALKRAEESLKIIKNQSFANFIKGEILSETKNYSEALNSYLKMKEAQFTSDVIARIVGDYHLPEEALAFRLGRCYVALNQWENAYKQFQYGNSINPNDVSCIIGLSNFAYYNKNYAKSKELLIKASELEPNREDVKTFLKQVEFAISNEKNNESKLKIELPNIIHQNTILQKIEPTESPSYKNKKPIISLSMIVKNEEEMLPGCLKSVQGIAEEIVIVDTGSSDNTINIANEFGAKIYNIPWNNDFAAARNESLKHCTGEWILYLDADERLDIDKDFDIIRFLKELNNDIGGVVCTIESEHLQLSGSTEKHRGGYPRIFRNYGYPNIYFQGRVHEQITPSIFNLNKNMTFSYIRIIHLGYNQSKEVMESKIKRNYKMLIEHVREEPLNGFAWYQLGQTLGQMKLFKEAEEAVRFALENGGLSNSVHASAAATLAQLVGNQKKFEEALYWAEQSLEKAPEQIYALHLKGYSLLYLGYPEQAENIFYEVLNRVRQKKGIPRSGFDIDIPEEVVLKSIEEAKKRRNIS